MIPFPLLILGLAALGGRKSNGATTQRKPATTTAARAASAGTAASGAAAALTTSSATPAQAAQELADYLRGGGSFGLKGKPSAEVLRVQKLIGVSPADGIVGPKTRNATRALGVILPLRPSTRQPAGVEPAESV